jgi:dipeptidyl aminopeptidase/acylaminoacyl peptidase
LYEQRSPLFHADRIRCPVLFFQGLKDKVVPPEQTERMAEALRSNGIPVEVRLFNDEGHGFRNQATQIQVLEETEAFFRRQLGLSEQRK